MDEIIQNQTDNQNALSENQIAGSAVAEQNPGQTQTAQVEQTTTQPTSGGPNEAFAEMRRANEAHTQKFNQLAELGINVDQLIAEKQKAQNAAAARAKGVSPEVHELQQWKESQEQQFAVNQMVQAKQTEFAQLAQAYQLPTDFAAQVAAEMEQKYGDSIYQSNIPLEVIFRGMYADKVAGFDQARHTANIQPTAAFIPGHGTPNTGVQSSTEEAAARQALVKERLKQYR